MVHGSAYFNRNGSVNTIQCASHTASPTTKYRENYPEEPAEPGAPPTEYNSIRLPGILAGESRLEPYALIDDTSSPGETSS